MQNQGTGPSPRQARKPRKRLAPSEKYEVFVQVLTQQATQREAAEKHGVGRSTVVHICRTAKQGALDALAAAVPGRPGQSAEAAGLAAAKAELERLRATGMFSRGAYRDIRGVFLISPGQRLINNR